MPGIPEGGTVVRRELSPNARAFLTSTLLVPNTDRLLRHDLRPAGVDDQRHGRVECYLENPLSACLTPPLVASSFAVRGPPVLTQKFKLGHYPAAQLIDLVRKVRYDAELTMDYSDISWSHASQQSWCI
jgi:hypothetical protein